MKSTRATEKMVLAAGKIDLLDAGLPKTSNFVKKIKIWKAQKSEEKWNEVGLYFINTADL